LALPIRWRWKFERFVDQVKVFFGGGTKEPPRPRLCPACGTLVGASASKCHQCGASMTYSLAAASRSLGGVFKSDAPVTYVILLVTCALFGFSLMATIRAAGEFTPPSGGIGGLFNLGAISGNILARLGASLPLPYDLHQPWRFIMAVFLHGSILHIGFNMWVIMDVGPQIEELYGSARYLFIYVFTGAFGYVVSSFFGHFSVGASSSLLGLIGVMLALTSVRHNASMQMLRKQLIMWLIYIAVMGFWMSYIDNSAHAGGFVAGYLLGRVMLDRPPADAAERKRAYALGWLTGTAVVLSFAFMVMYFLHSS
jgi:membrane associated rhomboid family serine protease